jgi:cardiolipin synthase
LRALEKRARAGVEVRLLVDAFGSKKLDRRWRKELEQAGCKVGRFRPLNPLTVMRVLRRDHRRALVVDGHVAFTGGGAIADKWLGNAQDQEHWRDNMVRVSGPLVAGVQTAFGENWTYATGEVLAGARFYSEEEDPRPGLASRGAATESTTAGSIDRENPPETTDSDHVDPRSGGVPAFPAAIAVISSPSEAAQPIRLLYWLSFKGARQRIYVASSYFVPSKAIRAQLEERARAGADVRILVPGEINDARTIRLAGRLYYEELLQAGARIFEYNPTMMHAKTAVIDGIWSIVGSSNMDERSTELNEENNLAIADPRLARRIETGFLADLQQSREIRLDEWRKRSSWERIKERLSALLIEQY